MGDQSEVGLTLPEYTVELLELLIQLTWAIRSRPRPPRVYSGAARALDTVNMGDQAEVGLTLAEYTVELLELLIQLTWATKPK